MQFPSVTLIPLVSRFEIFLVKPNLSFNAYPKDRQSVSTTEKKLTLLDLLRDVKGQSIAQSIGDWGASQKVVLIIFDFCRRCLLGYSFQIQLQSTWVSPIHTLAFGLTF